MRWAKLELESPNEAARAARALAALRYEDLTEDERELCPPILYGTGLAPALDWLGTETKAKYGLTVTVDADPAAEPDDEDMRVLLFEAVR